MTPQEKSVIALAVLWKRMWDKTGMPVVGTETRVAYTDRSLYEAVQAYEEAVVDAALKEK